MTVIGQLIKFLQTVKITQI